VDRDPPFSGDGDDFGGDDAHHQQPSHIKDRLGIRLLSLNLNQTTSVSSFFLAQFSELVERYQVNVICIQEVFQDSRDSFFGGLAHQLVKAANLQASFFQLISPQTPLGCGHLIISRWPIDRPHMVPLFNLGHQLEWGALQANILTPHGPVSTLTSSLTNGYRRQNSQLRQLIQTSHSMGSTASHHSTPSPSSVSPLIWTGGFHDRWNLQATGRMFREGLSCAQAADGFVNTVPSFCPIWASDKIYYRGPISSRSLRAIRIPGDRRLWPHQALLWDMELLQPEIRPTQ
jgi:endonuclease/exonuclease/phosphatase family metal-dependent hydrolase